jgi:hypothetical protein
LQTLVSKRRETTPEVLCGRYAAAMTQ